MKRASVYRKWGGGVEADKHTYRREAWKEGKRVEKGAWGATEDGENIMEQ